MANIIPENFNEEEERGLKGNKGEWSEIYVFLSLLATGRLDVADENLQAVPNEFYKVLEILRNETDSTNYYVREDDVINIICTDNEGYEQKFTFPIADFADKAKYLFDKMKSKSESKSKSKSKKKGNYYPYISDFLSEIHVNSIKDIGHKRDITIKIEDFHTKSKQILGFSIKSYIGSNSTLFNAAVGTNFIYRVELPQGKSLDIDKFNVETYSLPSKIKSRIKKLVNEYQAKIIFEKVQSDCFSQNLFIIDGQLPLLLSHLILARYLKSKSTSIKDCTKALTEINPLGFDIETHGQVYEYKIKRFLHDCALGMVPDTPWTGIYDATGGQIIVKKDGNIVCYHIYEINRFMQYLLNTTKLEEASTSEDADNPGHPREKKPGDKNPPKPFKYGWLYNENGNIYIKLNLQVRYR